MSNKLPIYIAVLLVLLVLLLCVVGYTYQTHYADSDKIEKLLASIDQDPSHYVQQDVRVNPQQQAGWTAQFLANYFSPWMQQSPKFLAEIMVQEREALQTALDQPAWGVNFHHLSRHWIQDIEQNADLKSFPNIKQPGIMISEAPVRTMPSLLPSFHNPQQPGEGYPFDNWQISNIAVGYPVYIVHQTKDGLWYLIATSSYQGWVPSQRVAFAGGDFQQAWRAHPFVVSMRDNVTAVNQTGRSLAILRMGSLYPQLAEEEGRVKLMLPLKNAEGDAEAVELWADKTAVRVFPLPLSTRAIATALQEFMDTPYGWGGLYHQRDCSATIQDVFGLFGIWLPRNSQQQINNSRFVSLEDLTPAEKLKPLHTSALPFYTLIHFPGHVAIYLGQWQGQDYILHDNWGIVTKNIWGKEGRIIVGRTLITPLRYPLGFYNVPKDFLQKATGFSNLGPRMTKDLYAT